MKNLREKYSTLLVVCELLDSMCKYFTGSLFDPFEVVRCIQRLGLKYSVERLKTQNPLRVKAASPALPEGWQCASLGGLLHRSP